jgi:hypothetical protein
MTTMSKAASGRRRNNAAAPRRTSPARRKPRDWRQFVTKAVVWVMILGLIAAIAAVGVLTTVRH